mmetsp:Transcript_20537/g.61823  ORF Transcript_20537/g.61823 Transcript_20537/m.61823 type:complete len:117 (-) Transcript_20537:290-640(-)
MQSVLASSTSIVRPVVATRSTGRVTASRVVVCRAQQQPKQSPVRKAAAAAVALPALLAAHPAFALVDDRLGGEGTGKILGGAPWPVFLVAAGVWALFYSGTQDLGGDKGEDSGLGL